MDDFEENQSSQEEIKNDEKETDEEKEIETVLLNNINCSLSN